LKELLKQSSNQPTKLNPDELLKVQMSLNKGIKYRAEYNHKTYNTLPKNKGLNFKSSSNKIKNIKIDVPKVVGQTTAQRPFEERVPVSNGISTVVEEISTSKATQVSTQAKKQPTASSGGSGGGGGSGTSSSGSLSAKMLSLTALMNNEKDPKKKYQLLAQLIEVTSQRNLALSREKEAEQKRLSKIKIR